MNFVVHPTLEKDSLKVASLPLCELRLINNMLYPWFILVPQIQSVREVCDLSDSDREQFHKESHWLSLVLKRAFMPDKLNVAALGNMVPQLHVHHIARYATDAAWPAPVWGKDTKAYSKEALSQMLQLFVQACEHIPCDFEVTFEAPSEVLSKMP